MKNFILIFILVFQGYFYLRAQNNVEIWYKPYFDSNESINFVDMKISGNNDIIILGHTNTYILFSYSQNGFLNWKVSYPDTLIVHNYPLESVHVDSLGNIYIVGNRKISEKNFKQFIIKYDKDGNILWQVFTNNLFYESSYMDNHGNLYIFNQDKSGVLKIYKYSNSGKLLWKSDTVLTLPEIKYHYENPKLVVDANQHIYLAVEVWDGFLLYKFNRYGKKIWINKQKLSAGFYEDGPRGVMLDSEGNIIVVGQHTKDSENIFISSYTNVLTLKYNTSGSLLWKVMDGQDEFQNSPKKFLLDFDNAIYIVGVKAFGDWSSKKYYLRKYDDSGKLIWNDTFKDVYDLTDLTIDQNENIFLIGPTKSNPKNVNIYKINKDGKILESTVLERNYSEIPYKILVNNSKEIIIGGNLELYGKKFIFCSKLSSNLLTGVENKKLFITNYKIYNYPNPFNSNTTIEFNIPHKGKVQIEVYDLSGKKIYNFSKNYDFPGKYKLNLNLNYLSSGVYFYNFISRKFSTTKKMLLIR